MADERACGKWNRRYADAAAHSPAPAGVLTEYGYLLPTGGTALDLACGRGGNALFLARRGLEVQAWDISEEAVDGLDREAKAKGLAIRACTRDVRGQPPQANTFDVICVSYYLERDICDAIISALRARGILFYQTFIHEKVTDEGPRNPAYRLGPNELLELFASLHVLAYRELGCVGHTGRGTRDTAWLVAQKR